MGFAHVEASPLTRSSYHAKQAVEASSAGSPTLPQLEMSCRPADTAPADPWLARAARMARVRDRMRETGVDALLLSLGADLPWLTGYEAMPLERLTMLVVPVDDEATLVVPELEAPRVAARSAPVRDAPMGGEREPAEIVARLVGKRTQLAVSDRCWASHLLELEQAMPARRVAQRRAKSSGRCGQ